MNQRSFSSKLQTTFEELNAFEYLNVTGQRYCSVLSFCIFTNNITVCYFMLGYAIGYGKLQKGYNKLCRS